VPGLAALRSGRSWDAEFFVKEPRHTPALQVEVVDQKTFDHFNTEESYGLTKTDTNEQLINSERGWIEGEIEAEFSPPLEAQKDYTIPFQWAGARSMTVVLQSERAMKQFPKLVLAMQRVLSHAKHDWIIYFQSVDEEFIVWVYPEKIMVTENFAAWVKRAVKAGKAG
jgi:hypothetical protein